MEFSFSVQNIEDGQGIAIALTGMVIVFSVLVFISAFIAFLPRMLVGLAKWFPEVDVEGEAPARDEDDGVALAAIAYVLHSRRVGKL